MNGGIGLLEILCVIFIILKLCGIIAWSWWLVLIPLWIGIGLGILLALMLLATGRTPADLNETLKKLRDG